MKITRRQLRQIIKEAIDSDGDGALNADELRDLADNLEDDIDPNIQKLREKYDKAFVCSASWHRQKRLQENTELFLLLKKQ